MQDIYFQLCRPMGGEVKISKQIKKEMAQPAALVFWLGWFWGMENGEGKIAEKMSSSSV